MYFQHFLQEAKLLMQAIDRKRTSIAQDYPVSALKCSTKKLVF
jgi:hypothetical protein